MTSTETIIKQDGYLEIEGSGGGTSDISEDGWGLCSEGGGGGIEEDFVFGDDWPGV